jgi:HD-like signal output (HDOD) protein
MKVDVLEMLKRSAVIPSMPQVVTRFMEIIQDWDFNYNELVGVLSVDPGTTSELLRLANSALFGVTRQITSLRQALTLLGPKRVRSLVLGRYIVETVGKGQGLPIDTSYYWRRSLTASVLSAHFADTLTPRNREEAFIAALLADVGVMVLVEGMPVESARLCDSYRPQGPVHTAADELEAIGVTHAEVSGLVLEHWQLPDLICHAVRQHQDADPDATDSGTLAGILAGADQIAKLLCETPDPQTVSTVCKNALDHAGLELQVFVDLIGQVECDVEELATILHLDVIPSGVYTMIAETMRQELEAAQA